MLEFNRDAIPGVIFSAIGTLIALILLGWQPALLFLFGCMVGSIRYHPPRRGLSPDWQPPRRNPEPQVSNWDAVKARLAEIDCAPRDRSKP